MGTLSRNGLIQFISGFSKAFLKEKQMGHFSILLKMSGLLLMLTHLKSVVHFNTPENVRPKVPDVLRGYGNGTWG